MAEQQRPAPHHFWGKPAPPTPNVTPGHHAPPHDYQTPIVPQSAPAPAPAPAPPYPASTERPSAPEPMFTNLPPKGEPVRLYDNKIEREQVEDMSAVFSLITATERLENIWARRGAISHENYEQQCEKLIQQYNVLRDSTAATIPNVDKFIAEYDCKASRARPRLRAGVPATVGAPGAAATKPRDQGKFVMRCTTLFHYVANCIEMNQTAVGMLLPDLISLMKTLNRIPTLGQGFEFNARIRFWVEKLNSMPASDELSAEDASQLKLDLDNGFAEFESAYND